MVRAIGVSLTDGNNAVSQSYRDLGLAKVGVSDARFPLLFDGIVQD